MGGRGPSDWGDRVNRTARRMQRRTRSRDRVHNAILLPLSTAIALNDEMPMPGLAEVLYATRADVGPDVMVGICSDCQTVEVVA